VTTRIRDEPTRAVRKESTVGKLFAMRCAITARDPELGEQRTSFAVEEYVFGLDVAMDDTGFVRVVERETELVQNIHCARFVEPSLASEAVAQALSGNELHREIQQPIFLADGVDLHDVRMPQLGDAAGLLNEALAELDGAGHLWGDDLDGNRAIKRLVVREEYRAHAALSQQTIDTILVAEGNGEALQQVGGNGFGHVHTISPNRVRSATAPVSGRGEKGGSCSSRNPWLFVQSHAETGAA